MIQSSRSARTAALAIALAFGPTVARAQTWDNPALPHSPYALPEPVSREPDVDDFIEGNGKLHFSGQWRHWGDSRNTGELAQMLLAPDQAPHRRTRNGLPQSRFCNDFPDRC